MGEIADEMIGRMIDGMFDRYDIDEFDLPIYDRGHRPLTKDGRWVTRDGEQLRIKDMRTPHLINAANLCRRTGNDEKADELLAEVNRRRAPPPEEEEDDFGY